MKIGVYSGTLDPLTNGHLWIINEGSKIFDALYVVVGHHPAKNHLFNKNQRLEMTMECTEISNVYVGEIGAGSILDWIDDHLAWALHPNHSVSLVRGIRNDVDLDYESNIANAVYARTNKLRMKIHQTFLIPPLHLQDISSSFVKKRCEVGNWDVVSRCVPWPVMKLLQEYYIDQKTEHGRANKSLSGGRANKSLSGRTCKWLECSPEVASIFETTTAGFAPAPSETTTAGFAPPKNFIGQFDPIIYNAAERGSDFFASLVKNGFINFALSVSPEQVRAMLDPFPVDLVVSQMFHLHSINIDSVKPLGKRHLPRSQSFGPIIVEANEVIGDNNEKLGLGVLGPNIIIEGKHRWLDAKDIGQKTILAWVGNRSSLSI